MGGRKPCASIATALVSASVKRKGSGQPIQAAGTRQSAVAFWLEKCRGRDWLFLIFLAGATLIAYLPVCHAGFLWDDGALLLNNDVVKQPDGWWRVWCTKGADYVPVTSTSFWLEWRLLGTHPLGYHLDNVILHGLNAALLWRVLRRLGVPGARLAALLFALHPVNVASVAWIAERKNTLALAFYACSLLWYLRFEDAGQRRWYWLAVGAFVLAIFSKAAAVPLPVVLLGMAWWRRGRIEWRDVTRSLLLFAMAAGASALAIWVQREGSSATARTADFWSRIQEAGCAVWFYLGKALLPLNLIPVYPMWHFDEANMAFYLPGLSVLAVMAAGWRYQKQWGRVILGGFGYFVLLLMPVLGFVNISLMRYTLVADQWQYFAIIGPIAVVAGGVAWALRHIAKGIAFAPAVCCALVVTLGVLTWKQSSLYANPTTLWQATLQANPDSFLAHSSLGSLLFKSGKAAEAEAEYETALKIEPNFDDAHYDLGNIYLQTGRPAKAIAEYRRVVEIRPDFVLAFNNMAWVLATSREASVRNGAEAIEYAKRANQLSRGSSPSIMATLGAAYAERGKFAEAIATVQEALRIATRQHDEVGIKQLGRQLALYQKGTPYRDPPTTGEARNVLR